MITQTRLREVMHYEPETGEFTRLSGRRYGPVGTVTEKGYLRISVLGELHYAQRLAFLYMTGEWPTAIADHENGNPLDNRWENLRDADFSSSVANTIVRSTSSNSIKGVSSMFDARYDVTYMVAKARFRNKERAKHFSVRKMGLLEATYAAAVAARDMRDEMHGKFVCHGNR